LILVVIAVTFGKQISIDFVVVHISKGTGVIKILDANDLSHLAPLGGGRCDIGITHSPSVLTTS